MTTTATWTYPTMDPHISTMGADLIVMSSHRPAMRTYFLGSTAGHVVRFADGGCGSGEDEERLRRVLPAASSITLAPMPLKAIFIAMARGFRGSAGRLRLGAEPVAVTGGSTPGTAR